MDASKRQREVEDTPPRMHLNMPDRQRYTEIKSQPWAHRKSSWGRGGGGKRRGILGDVGLPLKCDLTAHFKSLPSAGAILNEEKWEGGHPSPQLASGDTTPIDPASASSSSSAPPTQRGGRYGGEEGLQSVASDTEPQADTCDGGRCHCLLANQTYQ